MNAPQGLLSDLLGALPVLVLFAGALAVMVVEALFRPRDTFPHRLVSLASLALALGLVVLAPGEGDAFGGMLSFDRFGAFFDVVFLVSALLAVLISPACLERDQVRVGEYYALVLFAAMGMMLMGSAADLVMIFVALELMSLSFYVLSAIKRDDPRSVEAGFKYFILGAFSSGLLLYGIAFVYGATGSTGLAAVRGALASGGADHGLLMVGAGLLLAGFGFKVAAVPFHMWAPDVYQGAPSSVTGYMATGVKAAAFAAFARVLVVAFGGVQGELWLPLWIMAALTMLLGNIAALAQSDLKRMLAYSSIAHAGYLLMAMVPAGGARASGLLYYLLAYTFMNLGAFAVASLMAGGGRELTAIDRLAGLASRRPWLALGLSICLLSLAGVPPTMGFVGKFYLFSAAVRGGYPWLATIGAVSAAIGVYYYLRPIVLMTMRPAEQGADVVPARGPVLVLGVCSVAILALGLLPADLLAVCRAGIASLGG